MAKTRSMTRNQNNDDDASSSSRKRSKYCDNGGAGSWSKLNHDVLFLVVMQLGVVDYLSFGGVCKSWRSFALSHKNTFMASIPPISIRIYWRTHIKACYLEDFKGRKFKTFLPRFPGGVCVGLTCGYLIFFDRTSHNFWLVNPITRHKLYFPDFPIYHRHYLGSQNVKAILVFSVSICGWVIVVMRKNYTKIWFSIEGKGTWNHVSCSSHFTDICAFKGTIYALKFNRSNLCAHLFELRLNPEPKLTLLEVNNSLKPSCIPQLVSSGENIFVMDRIPHNGNIYMMNRTPEDWYRFQELDFDDMKWVLRVKKMGEYASFLSNLKHGVADKSQFWESCGQCLLVGHNKGDMLKLIKVKKESSITANMWYFPHECLNVDLIDE